MKSYLAFLKKELLEYSRTFKLWILIVVFLLLGLMNPLTAKFTPELFENFMPEGMTITIAETTILDCWMQFFKNVPQLGIIVLIIMFSGIMANELSRQTLVIMLTKGMPRLTVILAKFTTAGLLWTVCYWLSFAVTLLYGEVFWTDTTVSNLGVAVFVVWVFGLLLISALILGGVLFRNYYGSLLLTGTVVVVMFLINIPRQIARFSPIRLVSVNMELLSGTITASDIYRPLAVTVVLLLAFLGLSIIVFNKKKI